MGKCHSDHPKEDVKNEFGDQAKYLPNEIKELFQRFFQEDHSQEMYNEVFHLLKKYDLADEEERESRNKQFLLVLQNI